MAMRRLREREQDEEKPSYGTQEKSYSGGERSEEEEDGICGWCCCRTIAHIEVKGLERHHHKVLGLAQLMAVAGVCLSFAAFWGGFSGPGHGLRSLPWMMYERNNAETGLVTGVAGVNVLCVTSGDVSASSVNFPPGLGYTQDGLRCRRWKDMSCENAWDTSACEVCQAQSKSTIVPCCIATITYLLFARNTHKRYAGQDSNKVKVMSCFSAFVGGTNFSSVLLAYTKSCILNQEHIGGASATMGRGLELMIAAAVLKLLAGALHLCLPVRHGDPKDSVSEDY